MVFDVSMGISEETIGLPLRDYVIDSQKLLYLFGCI